MNATTSDTNATRVKYDGKTYVVTTYVDPYPGHKGTDRIAFRETCTRCGGTGVYRWWTQNGEAQGTCFLCCGERTNVRTRAVSSLRRDAKVEAVWREHGDAIRAESAAKMAEAEAARVAAEYAAAWDEAHAEQERRAALVTGFVAEVGEKVDAIGTVTVATKFEREAYRGYGATEMVALVVIELDGGKVVKAVGTGISLYGVARGDRVRVKGTVKSHATYKGQDQTVLTRTKLTDA